MLPKETVHLKYCKLPTQQSGENNGIYMLIPGGPTFNSIPSGHIPGGIK